MRIYKRSRRVKREILVGVLSKFVAESVEVDQTERRQEEE